jgi:hypothetical protein
MNGFRHKRAWFWVAIAAIVITLVALLVPHVGNSPDQQGWLALLPIFFVGLIAPFSLLPLLANLAVGSIPTAPALVATFQRPPPSFA